MIVKSYIIIIYSSSLLRAKYLSLIWFNSAVWSVLPWLQ